MTLFSIPIFENLHTVELKSPHIKDKIAYRRALDRFLKGEIWKDATSPTTKTRSPLTMPNFWSRLPLATVLIVIGIGLLITAVVYSTNLFLIRLAIRKWSHQ